MTCIKPIPLKDPEMLVPCGYCYPCLKRKAMDWSFRLLQEFNVSKHSKFLTLTYNDQNVPHGDGMLSLAKGDLVNYFKRVRSKTPFLKYYAVGEYGTETNRPHYHAIVFNSDNDTLHDKWSIKDEEIGFTHIGETTPASIYYTTSYVINKLKYAKRKQEKPFSIMSKGIGDSYLKKTFEYHKKGLVDHVTLPGGLRQPLPRYYRDKIFTEEEKKILNSITQKKQEEQLSKKTWEYITLEIDHFKTLLTTKNKLKL